MTTKISPPPSRPSYAAKATKWPWSTVRTEAVPSVEQRRPDVLILDVMFPENPSAGFELARTVQRKFADIPVLMLTAVNQQFPLGFSNRDIDPKWLPVTEFIEKPVDFGVLCDKVKKLADRK